MAATGCHLPLTSPKKGKNLKKKSYMKVPHDSHLIFLSLCPVVLMLYFVDVAVVLSCRRVSRCAVLIVFVQHFSFVCWCECSLARVSVCRFINNARTHLE